MLFLHAIAFLTTLAAGKSFHRGYDTNTINRAMRKTISGYPCILNLDANRSIGCSRIFLNYFSRYCFILFVITQSFTS